MIIDLKVTKQHVTLKMKRAQAARLVNEIECYHRKIQNEMQSIAADLTAVSASHDPHDEYEGSIRDLPEEKRDDILKRSIKRHEEIRDLCDRLEWTARDAAWARHFVQDAYDWHVDWQCEEIY